MTDTSNESKDDIIKSPPKYFIMKMEGIDESIVSFKKKQESLIAVVD